MNKGILVFIAILPFSAVAGQGLHLNEDVRSTLDEGGRACRNQLMPDNLPTDHVLDEIQALLAGNPELKGVRFERDSGFPLLFLEIIRDLIKAKDPGFHRIMLNAAKVALREDSLRKDTSSDMSSLGRLDIYIEAIIYPVFHLHFFANELSDNNIRMFLPGFQHAINGVAEQIRLGVDVEELSGRVSRKDLAWSKDLLAWLASKRAGLEEVVSNCRTHPELLKKPDENVRWALRVANFINSNIQHHDISRNQIASADLNIIEAIGSWYPPLDAKFPHDAGKVSLEPPPPSFLDKVTSFFARKDPQPTVPYRPYTQNVILDPRDPLWIFSQQSSAGAVRTFLGDYFYFDRKPHFESLVNRNMIGDFYDKYKLYNDVWAWIDGSKGLAHITGKTSRGLAKEYRGEKFIREMFWPSSQMAGYPFLDRMRVAVTKTADGIPLTLEVLASEDGIDWHPFFFHREGDFWIRDTHIKGKPIYDVCITCHESDGEGFVPKGKLSPRPNFMKSRQDYEGVGYKWNEKPGSRGFQLIKEFLKY